MAFKNLLHGICVIHTAVEAFDIGIEVYADNECFFHQAYSRLWDILLFRGC